MVVQALGSEHQMALMLLALNSVLSEVEQPSFVALRRLTVLMEHEHLLLLRLLLCLALKLVLRGLLLEEL
jgi:hypothetical protein